MASQPVVEYYRLVYDAATSGFTFLGGASATPAETLDFGIVDAGLDTYEDDNSKLIENKLSCQVFAIYNNKSGQSAVSDMQNTTLSVVDFNGRTTPSDPIYSGRWIQVLINDENHSDGWTSLGKSLSSGSIPLTNASSSMYLKLFKNLVILANSKSGFFNLYISFNLSNEYL